MNQETADTDDSPPVAEVAASPATTESPPMTVTTTPDTETVVTSLYPSIPESYHTIEEMHADWHGLSGSLFVDHGGVKKLNVPANAKKNPYRAQLTASMKKRVQRLAHINRFITQKMLLLIHP